MKVALLGGAFDPPHLGHVLTVSRILNSGDFDQVWLVPAGERVDKRYHASAQQRLEMLEAVRQEYWESDPRVRIERCQIDERLPGSYAIDLLEFARGSSPQDEFWFVIGDDLIADLPRWHQGARLLKEEAFLIVSRPGKTASLAGSRMQRLRDPLDMGSGISSSAVRQLLKQSGDTAGVLPAPVRRIIEREGLYR